MKSIVKIRELTLICDESYGNGTQAQLGLLFTKSMPKHRGMIFYLDKEISCMAFGAMDLKIDAISVVNGFVTTIAQVSSKIWIEMNNGLMKEYGIVDGTPVSIERVLDGWLNGDGDQPETRQDCVLRQNLGFLSRLLGWFRAGTRAVSSFRCWLF